MVLRWVRSRNSRHRQGSASASTADTTRDPEDLRDRRRILADNRGSATRPRPPSASPWRPVGPPSAVTRASMASPGCSVRSPAARRCVVGRRRRGLRIQWAERRWHDDGTGVEQGEQGRSALPEWSSSHMIQTSMFMFDRSVVVPRADRGGIRICSEPGQLVRTGSGARPVECSSSHSDSGMSSR
jgi:hypothetical protein